MKHTLTQFFGVIGLLFVLVFTGCETPDIKFGPGARQEYQGEINNELVIAEPVGVSPTEPTLPSARIDIDETQPPKKKGLFGFLKKKKEPEPNPEGTGGSSTPEVSMGPVVSEQPVVPKTEAELGSIDGGVEYKLQVGDSVVVKIGPPIGTDVADKLNGRGEINLPIIGDISAVGLTVTGLEELIKQTYVSKEITKEPPHVTVATDIKFYYIQGEVRSGGGRYPLLPPMTLTKAVAAASGFTDWAKQKKIKIFRGNKILTVNYEMIKVDIRADVEVKANDLIVVEKSGFLNN